MGKLFSAITKRQDKSACIKIRELDEELWDVIEAMAASDSRFNESEDPKLTEAFIYEKASLSARYGYLMEKRREYFGGGIDKKK